MPEFILDTSGVVVADNAATLHPPHVTTWRDLDAFTQGYIEALFFTETDIGGTPATFDPENGSALPCDAGFCDLAPEALAQILADCAAFRATQEKNLHFCVAPRFFDLDDGDTWRSAGRDFWYTRNGHGCGFWDGDWPEPYATQLTDAAKAFGNVDAYLGDDDLVHLM